MRFPLIYALSIFYLTCSSLLAQPNWDAIVEQKMPEVVADHRALVAVPNVADNHDNMLKNAALMQTAFEKEGFSVDLLPSTSLPVFLAERMVSEKYKTILFYFHLDGQPVNPEKWYQDDPFIPVLKKQNEEKQWVEMDWAEAERVPVDPEWRIFARAAADDKGPITMMLTALELMRTHGQRLKFNIKVILDLQEEMGSHGFLSTMEEHKQRYEADYMIIMDGPAHYSNAPTLTFGCRGIAKCDIKVYGAKLPQHSGHFGNYAPNPVFRMAHLLSSMKNEVGKVTIDDFYSGIEIDSATAAILDAIPDDTDELNRRLHIHSQDEVGCNYQESLQYPSLNVRHIETSWKGPGLKTVIPEFCMAHLDVRLVKETDGAVQLEKIRKHIEKEGFYVIDRDPTDEERLKYPLIATFTGSPGVNAFRTDLDSPFGQQLRTAIEGAFTDPIVSIRTMGGTIPIIPAVNALGFPAVIVPMVNMDNNQHAPNENIRLGNMEDGIKICLAILSRKFD